MNCAGNTYPFRQDSSFRYFAGHNQPDLVLTVDAGTGESRLYGNDRSLDDIVWMGEATSVAELASQCGADYGGDLMALASYLRSREDIHFLPPYREERRRRLRDWSGGAAGEASPELIRAVVQLRSVKDEEEIIEMDRAVRFSREMHRSAARALKPGMQEAEISGALIGMAGQAGYRLAYPAIVTRNGHILHNHYYGNVLQPGDLLLIDAGAEVDTGYAGDITRTITVGAEPTDRQEAILNIVDQARADSINTIRPGVPYREIHDLSARIIFEGLKDLDLTKGDAEEAVAAGAHALFYPHGLGHMIGLDVHDMEDLGEDFVGYDQEIQRSKLFGTRNLRLGRRLQAGFCLTVEPGVYFIPALIDRWRAEGKHLDFINYDAVEKWRDFGGVRLEDDVVVTEAGRRVLGD